MPLLWKADLTTFPPMCLICQVALPLGRQLEDVSRNIREAIAFHLDGMVEDGDLMRLKTV